jgi:MFS family permease
VVSFAAAAPLLVFTMWGGVIADNVDRRKMLLYAQYVMAGSALALSVLCFTHTVRVGHVLVLALLTGVAAAVAAPAQQAVVPMLVPRDVLTNAIGLNSAQFNMSRVVGPTVGGFFIAWFGAGGNFAFNALSFVALMVALQRITLIQPEPKDPTSSLWVRLRAGLRYVWGQTSMTLLILLVCVTALFGIPYISFAPVFARDVLHVGAEGLGLLMAFAGLGSFFAALTIAYSGNPRRRGGWMAVSGTVFFCAVIGFSFSRNFALSSALLFVAGYAVIIMVALINTRLQHSAEEEMRGRAMSIYSTAYLGLPPVGSFAAGFLSRWMEAPLAIAAMAAAGLGIFLIMFGTSPQLRNME